mgnify:FL=1
MRKIRALFFAFFIAAFSLQAQTIKNNSGIYNVKNSGAKGDGINLDTKAINNAIEEAAAAGGGTVYFPAGSYLSGSVHLKSNITLYLDAGAILIAAPVENQSEYDLPENNVSNKYEDFGHRH